MKVVLAHSGGLDTTVCIKLLQDKWNAEAITVTCDVGQNENFEEIEKRAKMLGVKKQYLLDVKEELIRDYIFKAIEALPDRKVNRTVSMKTYMEGS